MVILFPISGETQHTDSATRDAGTADHSRRAGLPASIVPASDASSAFRQPTDSDSNSQTSETTTADFAETAESAGRNDTAEAEGHDDYYQPSYTAEPAAARACQPPAESDYRDDDTYGAGSSAQSGIQPLSNERNYEHRCRNFDVLEKN